MDAQRFDNLAKSLAGRFSRRNALRRAGVAASATLLASAGVRPVPAAAQGQDEPVYTVIRRYTLDSPTNAVRAALQRGYIEAPARLRASSPTSRSKTRTATSRRCRSSAARMISRNSPARRRIGSPRIWGTCSRPRRGALRGYLRLCGRDGGVPQHLPRHGGANDETRSDNRSRCPDRNGGADRRTPDRDTHSGALHRPRVRLLDRDAATVRPGFHLLPDD